MATKSIGGITGVVGRLISPSATHTSSPCPEQLLPESRHPDSVAVPQPQVVAGPQHARIGRPPARSPRRAGSKEKVTFRINSDLIAQYRDWSWEARCQIGDLVERALTTYRESCSSRR